MKSLKELGTRAIFALTSAKAKASVAATALALQMANPNVFAVVNTSGNADNMVMNIAEVVVGIFPLIGIFFVISGGFKMVMAYRNDQPEAQTAAAKDIVIGVVLIVFRAFIWTAIRAAIVA